MTARGFVVAMGIWILALAGAPTLMSACPHPAPGPAPVDPHPGLIACGAKGVADCVPQIASLVTGCLDGTQDVSACLWAIPTVVTCAGFEALACATRRAGSAAEHAAQAEGPVAGAGASWRRAARAKDFLQRTGAKFNDEGSGP
jgi:hypothetical protein